MDILGGTVEKNGVEGHSNEDRPVFASKVERGENERGGGRILDWPKNRKVFIM